MVETLLIIQTIAMVAILLIFIYVLLTIKKEFAVLLGEIKNLEKQIGPAVNETKELLDNVNKFMNTVGRGTKSAVQVIENVKNVSASLESVFTGLKSSFNKTKNTTSALKIGLMTGITSLVTYYLNRKKEEKT